MESTFKVEEFPFPLVMMDVIESQFTGIIFVSTDQWKKGLIFKNGSLCAIQSNRTDELLGNILVGMGIISEDKNTLSLNTTRLERRKQGSSSWRWGSSSPWRSTRRSGFRQKSAS